MAKSRGKTVPAHRDLADYPAIMTLDDYCDYYAISKATDLATHFHVQGPTCGFPLRVGDVPVTED